MQTLWSHQTSKGSHCLSLGSLQEGRCWDKSFPEENLFRGSTIKLDIWTDHHFGQLGFTLAGFPLGSLVEYALELFTQGWEREVSTTNFTPKIIKNSLWSAASLNCQVAWVWVPDAFHRWHLPWNQGRQEPREQEMQGSRELALPGHPFAKVI